MNPVLYDYWRSSAAYRLRIALNLLEIDYETVAVDLLAGANRHPENLSRNRQGLVPTLEFDGLTLTQSLAILEYLDETRSAGFLPEDPPGRARVRALAYAVAMEIHPVLNLSVAKTAQSLSGGAIEMKAWMHAFMPDRLAMLEAMLDHPATGPYCHGDQISLADICLVPQVYNARRWEVDLSHMPRILSIAAALEAIPPIAAAHPDRVKPAGIPS
ncbi:MAG: maleylacetoacetate isomerase [Pseudomonadota bacterium]